MPAHEHLIVGPKLEPVGLTLKCVSCGASVTVAATAMGPAFNMFFAAGSCAACAEAHRDKRAVEKNARATKH